VLFLRDHGLLLLLGFVPVSIALELLAPERHIAIFCTSVLAILPLAAYMGRATEALADHLGGGIGGLLNATFGNAAELIIGALALRAGLTDLVKASLTGSIIGNVLLVFGASALVGGLRRPVQRSIARRRGWALRCCCSARSASSFPPSSIGCHAGCRTRRSSSSTPRSRSCCSSPTAPAWCSR
jgi:Ca2+/H+ antiporter